MIRILAHNKLDLVGEKFNKLTVIDFAPSRPTPAGSSRTYWLCVCDCGKQTEKCTGQLRSGHTKSCGCSHTDMLVKRNTVHGLANSMPEYDVWKAMRRRTTNKNCQDYQYYGARGISVCERWQSFEAFITDMGRRPSDSHSIDRIDVNGNYEPTNCRWATPIEQRHNRRDSYA